MKCIFEDMTCEYSSEIDGCQRGCPYLIQRVQLMREEQHTPDN